MSERPPDLDPDRLCDPRGDVARKLEAIRAAVRHVHPTGDIDTMLAEIERGYETTIEGVDEAS